MIHTVAVPPCPVSLSVQKVIRVRVIQFDAFHAITPALPY